MPPPAKDKLKNFKDNHEWSSLLEGLPCALELVYTLDRWKNHRTPAPREILESLDRFQMAVALADKKLAEGDPRVEKLNSIINRVISDGTLGSGDAGSRPPVVPIPSIQQQDEPSRSHALPAFLRETTPSLSSSPIPPRGTPPSEPPEPTVKFSRAVSPGENATFIALFKAIEATPRKIKRVVNM